jgi:aldose sugar dehydrogenase
VCVAATETRDGHGGYDYADLYTDDGIFVDNFTDEGFAQDVRRPSLDAESPIAMISLSTLRIRGRLALFCVLLSLIASAAQAQAPRFPLGDGPWELQTYEPASRIRVSVVTEGLTHPWGLAFLPNGDMLVSERRGTLRVIRGGRLDPAPLAGMPAVAEASSGGLMDVALHPDFETNRWLYFVYAKPGEPPTGADYYATTALGRARFDGEALSGIEDVFIAKAWSTAPGGHGARILFADDGTLFMSQPHRRELDRAQDTTDHVGTILRLNDDGSVPADNPFVGRDGHLPEIYSYGHRVVEGLAFHPRTGALWATEHGPLGGDELNVIVPGGNYGWPLVTYGRDYDGTRVSDRPWREDLLEPELIWVPSIATSGLMFYTGERFPGWRGNVFVGALMHARMPGTGHVERIVFNDAGEQRREWLLSELKQRIRDVKQGPDGLLYVLTEEENGALLVIEPM